MCTLLVAVRRNNEHTQYLQSLVCRWHLAFCSLHHPILMDLNNSPSEQWARKTSLHSILLASSQGFAYKQYYFTTGSRTPFQRPVAKFFLQPHLFQTMSLFRNDCTWWLNIHCVELWMIQKTSSKKRLPQKFECGNPNSIRYTLKSYWNLVNAMTSALADLHPTMWIAQKYTKML